VFSQTSVRVFLTSLTHKACDVFSEWPCLHHGVAVQGSQTLSDYDDAHGYTNSQNLLPSRGPRRVSQSPEWAIGGSISMS